MVVIDVIKVEKAETMIVEKCDIWSYLPWYGCAESQTECIPLRLHESTSVNIHI